MTTDLHHRRLRESRGAVLRAVWVGAALAGGLAGGIGLQLAGATVQARMASLAGAMLAGPSRTPTLAVRGTACPSGTLQAGTPAFSAHHRVRIATLNVAAAPES